MSRSRYDREAAFFDRLRALDQHHRVLSVALAWLVCVAASTLLMVGPAVGLFGFAAIAGRDPAGVEAAVAIAGGGVLVGSALMLLMGGRRIPADPQEDR
ncbi:hypothetical protein OG884_18630 [Streptosporangium sp. NBC_01755]|uniref:hypothetical protein n=1 Tax=unclassified Streptosporangium TaxID=2632669 RepID=UPI002DDBF12B|nr:MULTISPECIES: hypothetical protein [unclassified Streptosporangium]WSA23716.1 hypothetical protein OIE13_22505 [Streptosporangium sp. NBC_01810]WSD03824.1 hypothetical protein OG884_18630 [Streptosporangium sp. NBC_01755]